MTEYEGVTRGEGRRIAVVASRFHETLTERLVEGARAGLLAHGVDDADIDVAWVPGAFEIPLVARTLSSTGAYDAIVCLGVVIRGETAHFDLVANEAARGAARVADDTGVPVAFEVLAVETRAQAEARAGGVHGNKGWEAAEVALKMASLLETLERAGSGTRP